MTNLRGFRKTTQHLAPSRPEVPPPGTYNIYPSFPLGRGSIALGFEALAELLLATGARTFILDGFVGVLWDRFEDGLRAALNKNGLRVSITDVRAALKPEEAIRKRIEPFLGGDDPIFGTRFTGTLKDFFDTEKLRSLKPDPGADVNAIVGPGAALAGWHGVLVYIDLPKNEVQYRSRAGSICNIGASAPDDPQHMYKRFYFVDWPVLNRYRVQLLDRIDFFIDEQRPGEPAVAAWKDVRSGLTAMAQNVFRVRPWFEPGPWGGTWIKEHFPQVAQDVPNYAWSFELISPENGIAFESDGTLLEISFDFLMFHNFREVLGDFAGRFGYEFPIRYDFLDTVNGGNLSVQCHPTPEYIHRNFGETFTQDETYYILDCLPGARVYLGFQDDIDPHSLRRRLEESFAENTPVEIDRFVNSLPAHKHDLFLIPHGTIHCSGVDNLVLEISATPYIFTFKMYDWLRLDLDGKPRPLNIDRAFDNLRFERKGSRIREELVSRPRPLREGPDWKIEHLPTHPDHFYDVHRFEFGSIVEISTGGSCHVLNLVEGSSIVLETARGVRQRFNYAETFVVPAAAESYRLINEGTTPAKVLKTFLKPDAKPFAKPEGASE